MKTPEVLRRIPSVSEILSSPPVKALVGRLSRNVVVDRTKQFLDEFKADYQSDHPGETPSLTEIAERIAKKILSGQPPAVRTVINASGIVLHPGLGSTPLAESAIEAILEVTHNYASIDYNLKSGEFAAAQSGLEATLKQVVPCEAGLVVHNWNAALLLTVASLASGKEVLLSRGQHFESDGSGRLSDIISAAGATLCEVGTANITRIADYETILSEKTGAILYHAANHCQMIGVTESVPLAELAELARNRNIPLIVLAPTAGLFDLAEFGCQTTETIASFLSQGADLVLFAGDHLIGGPASGLIVGRDSLCTRIKACPWGSAFTPSKVVQVALAATLDLYRDPAKVLLSLPLYQLLSTPLENLKNRAERIGPQIEVASAIEKVEIVEKSAFLKPGELPSQKIPSMALRLIPSLRSPEALATQLRQARTPVVTRVTSDAVEIDLRAVFPRQDIELTEAIAGLS